MDHKKLNKGQTAYHSIFPHFGKGTVINSGMMTDYTRTPYRKKMMYVVRWTGLSRTKKDTTRCTASQLRVTFNKKRYEKIKTICPSYPELKDIGVGKC